MTFSDLLQKQCVFAACCAFRVRTSEGVKGSSAPQLSRSWSNREGLENQYVQPLQSGSASAKCHPHWMLTAGISMHFKIWRWTEEANVMFLFLFLPLITWTKQTESNSKLIAIFWFHLSYIWTPIYFGKSSWEAIVDECVHFMPEQNRFQHIG